jgi:hypothetical protein
MPTTIQSVDICIAGCLEMPRVVGDGLCRCKPHQGPPRCLHLVSPRPTDAHLRPGWVPGGRRHVRYTNLGTLNLTAKYLRHLLWYTIKLTNRTIFASTTNSASTTLFNITNIKSQRINRGPSLQDAIHKILHHYNPTTKLNHHHALHHPHRRIPHNSRRRPPDGRASRRASPAKAARLQRPLFEI